MRKINQKLKKFHHQPLKRSRLKRVQTLIQTMLRKKPSLQNHHRCKAQEIDLIRKLCQKQKIRRKKNRQNQLLNKFQRLLLSLKQIGMPSRTKMKILSHIFKIFRHRRLSLSLKSQRSPPKCSAEF